MQSTTISRSPITITNTFAIVGSIRCAIAHCPYRYTHPSTHELTAASLASLPSSSRSFFLPPAAAGRDSNYS